jgi:hypothetical protein
MIARARCHQCGSYPIVDRGPRGYRCLCPRRNRVAGRKPFSAAARGACPNTAPMHWRRSERAAIATWNAAQDSEHVVKVYKNEATPASRCRCGLLLPCSPCPLERHAIDRFAMARVGEAQPGWHDHGR